MNRKTKEIVLFGENLLLFERTANDVLSLIEYNKHKIQDNTLNDVVIQSIQIIVASLSPNIKPLSSGIWNKILRFFKLNANDKHVKSFNDKLTHSYLLHNLTQAQIFDLAGQVLELDGLKVKDTDDVKKKEAD